MKFAVLLLAFAALVAVTGSSAIKAARANLIIGQVGAGDRLLSHYYVYRPAVPNAIQYEDVIHRGNTTTRITAIQAREVGTTQFGSVHVLNGGVGFSNVTLRVTSYRGWGYYYDCQIWGR